LNLMDSSAFCLWCPLGVGFMVFIAFMIQRQFKRYQAIQARIEEVRQAEQSLAFFNPVDVEVEPPFAFLNHWDLRYRIETLNNPKTVSGDGLLSVSSKRLALYARSPEMPELLTFRPEQVRWYGRPKKYSSGRNEIWLHIEGDAGWMLLKIGLYQEPMRDLVRILKAVTAPELAVAYRRRRPYIHAGLVKAQPATQDIHGAWTLAEKVDLYLMPRFLVLLTGEQVARKIALETVQEIGALRRLDQPRADGLVRFRTGEETLAFALREHEGFGQALAEAAKRTLEAPIEQKQKGKKDDDWD
jgi:hypothetical protein